MKGAADEVRWRMLEIEHGRESVFAVEECTLSERMIGYCT